jgi:hypothetical protein
MNSNEAVLRAIASLSTKLDIQNSEMRKELGFLKSAFGNLERRQERLGELIAQNQTIIGVNQRMSNSEFIYFLTSTVPDQFYSFIGINLPFKTLVDSISKPSTMAMNTKDFEHIDLMIGKLRFKQPRKKSGESCVYQNAERSAWLGFLNKLYLIEESKLFIIKPDLPLISNVLG